MLDVEFRRPVTPAAVVALREVATLAARVAGHAVLGDAVWRDLARPSPDTALVIARNDAKTVVGALHLGPSDSLTSPHARMSCAVRPGEPIDEVAAALARPALEDHRRRGGGRLELWVFGADDTWDEIAAQLGLDRARELWQMRVSLPLAETPQWPPGVTVRTFEPGRDEEAWLAVNNRAFAGDPDQGGWSAATVGRREQEPWFDPVGFLLAFDADGLAGFCWTRLHPASPPIEPGPLGEIYVIGVNPDRQGQGLGQSLVVAGLSDLHDRQGAPVGMLFVDADNEAAVALYRSIGFSLARVDRAFACD